MQTSTTHSFELTYDELLKIIEVYVLEQDPSSSYLIPRSRKSKSIYIDNMSVSPSSKIYLRTVKKD